MDATDHPPLHRKFEEVCSLPLVFVGGKGGVGKTTLSRALSQKLSERSRVLWVGFSDPTHPAGELRKITDSLWELNCDPEKSFEEYVQLKLKIPGLSQFFVHNKLIRFLANAAPGMREILQLGKVWFEKEHYDHIVVDLPSTGHGIAFLKSPFNFEKLFKGSPLQKDAEEILKTLHNPKKSGVLIVAIPEEMPLVEALEHQRELLKMFPQNPPAFCVNQCFPGKANSNSSERGGLFPKSALDFVKRRLDLEMHNLRIWNEKRIHFLKLPFIPPHAETDMSLSLKNHLIKEII